MRKNIILVVSLLATQVFYAQLGNKLSDDKFLPNVTLPSPNAYSLGNFGNLEVGEFTGTPNINIPLLQFKGKGLNTDLSLSYTSSGIKVDEKDEQFGLGWTLVAGGVINRVVRNKDDFMDRQLLAPENLNGGPSDPRIAQFFYDAGNSGKDTEADLFSFSVGNISGQFVISKKGEIELLTKDDIKINIQYDVEHNPYFIMKDSKGITYYFTAIEQTSTSSVGGGLHGATTLAVTAWFLTKTEDTNGEMIIFEYDDDTPSYTMSKSQILSYSDPPSQAYCENLENGMTHVRYYSSPPTLGPIINNNISIDGKRLKRIISNRTSEKIEINANIGESIITHYYNSNIIEQLTFKFYKTANERLFLKSISSFSKEKDYSFEYIQPNAFPQRLAFSQDHWGYFNGTSNSNIIPKNIDYAPSNDYAGADKNPNPSTSVYGILNKVICPTKGWTTIEYEPNTYYGSEMIYPNPIDIREGLVLTSDDFELSKIFGIQPAVNQRIVIQGYGTFNSIDCRSEPDMGTRHRIDLSIRDLTTNRFVSMVSSDSNGNTTGIGSFTGVYFSRGNPNYYSFFAKAGHTYQFKMSASWQCTNGSVSLKYVNQTPTEVQKNIVVGGNRVAKMIDSDGNQQSIRRYYYGPKNNLNQSSGDKGLAPFYRDFRKWEPPCTTGLMPPLREAVITSSSIYPLFNSGRSNVYYKYVTTSFGGDNFEKGGVEKEFTVKRDYWGNQIFGSENVGSAPWTNFGWNNGYLKTEKFFDNQGNILKVNDYLWEKKNVTDNKSYYVRKNYSPNHPKNPVYTCTSEDVIRPDNGFYWKCKSDHRHFMNVSKWKCVALGADNEKVTFANNCYQQPLGKQIVHSLALENLDIVEYNNISYQKYLKSITTTDYVNNQPMKSTITENTYDSNLHYQQTSKKVTHLDNSITENGYQYAHEKGNQRLINANMVGIPLETSTTERRNVNDTSGKITSKVETKYDNPALLLPTSVISTDLQNIAKTEITYDKYDDKGNLQQYTTKDGISTVIIWGYDNTYPIAKIENIRYEDVSQSIINAIVNASNVDASAGKNNDETDLLNAFNTFRNGLSSNQVTTYTYDPLIGVRSITSPSGIRENYLYDSAGRLEKIIDADGRVVKEMKYNYKN
ncbi:RHS repeat domain-containing protein [Chryseobacterium indologenes]|uniref:RHS repeat domain-containing protein n=1 Tax=Chryseobacterium indologenes TaxID=253 RepID=UPI00076E29A7|nr:RHS repeat domain-containing protein [Chryseobacterium indologenes]